MKTFKNYMGIALPKNQAKLVDFIQSGNNEFWSFLPKKGRNMNLLYAASKFNRQLKRIQKRGLFMDIPFVYKLADGKFMWMNPGVKGSKSNFQALTLHDAQMELKAEINKIL